MRFYLAVLICFTLLFVSCKKDKGLSWKTNFSIPIAESIIRLSDIIPDTLIDQTSRTNNK